MEHREAESICTLKVNINCCTMCELKAKENLQKIKGVESVAYDSKGTVTVSGKVNPMVLLKKFEKWGKNAELLSLKKAPNQHVQPTPTHSDDKDPSCRCAAASDSDDNAGDRDAPPANKDDSAHITWQKPDFPIKPSFKSKPAKGLFGLFRKKRGGGKKMLGKPSTAAKWEVPKTPMPESGGGYRPHYNGPFEHYPPSVVGGPPLAHLHHPFGQMRPPYPPPQMVPPPPQGFFNSKPPPKVNPMVHYTSYADNFSYW